MTRLFLPFFCPPPPTRVLTPLSASFKMGFCQDRGFNANFGDQNDFFFSAFPRTQKCAQLSCVARPVKTLFLSPFIAHVFFVRTCNKVRFESDPVRSVCGMAPSPFFRVPPFFFLGEPPSVSHCPFFFFFFFFRFPVLPPESSCPKPECNHYLPASAMFFAGGRLPGLTDFSNPRTYTGD